MDIQISRYNFVFPFSNTPDGKPQRVLYNSRTGSLALIDEEKYRIYEEFANDSRPIEDEDLLADLKLGGFLIDATLNELELLRFNLLQSRYDKAAFSLTIAPTSNCNFRCVYCYEKDTIKPITMSVETQDMLIEFVERHLECVTHFSVSWYGGEPLLALGIIERLTTHFLRICNERNILYNADIVTNGYLLNNQMVDKLIAMKITNIQVTLDGAAEDHDSRRPLVGGFPTFQRIIDNLCSLKDRTDVSIAIRINADKHNIDRVDQIIDILNTQGLSHITRPYLDMVENLNGAYNDNSCFHRNEFSLIMYNFVLRNNLNVMEYIPIQITNYCGADYMGSFVINADGLLYKCWCEIGIEEKSIGSIYEGIEKFDLLFSYMLYDATTDQECSVCKYLPVCMGGCPFLRLTQPSLRCSQMKHSLNAFMDTIPLLLANQK